ncbi:MAG: hypothetical protein IKI66_02065 [Bacteroidales bacterium]|jgi:hypothetical protein|nr:hypothetical protein [Bacteroidales bacterium]
MATQSKNKARGGTDRKIGGTLIVIALVVVGFISYFAVPVVQAFFERVLVGWKGLACLLGGALVLEAWFLIIGYRGKALLYALGVLIFTILCIWLAINFDMVWDSMVSTLGLWPTILIVLLGSLGLWFVIKVLL